MKITKEITELRKDKERLDWLQSSGLLTQEWKEGDVLCRKAILSLRTFIDKQTEGAQ